MLLPTEIMAENYKNKTQQTRLDLRELSLKHRVK